MSLWNDDRRYSDGEEYRQWKQEIDYEYRKETACDRAYVEREDGDTDD